jgi:TonB family protein
MVPSTFMRLFLFLGVGLLGAVLGQTTSQSLVQAASSPVLSQTNSLGKRGVTFDFVHPEALGDIQNGKPLELSIAVSGMAQGNAPLVAICESIHFQRQVVTLEPDPLSMTVKATATLEPIPQGKLSMSPKVARVQVTFARPQKEKFERVMTRIVYVTLGKQEPVSDTSEPSLPSGEELHGEDASDDEVQPDVNPIAGGLVVEEDLLPQSTPGQGRAYWQHISDLLSQSWSRNVRRVRHSPSSETVRIRFRMYPSGRAQLIQVEKGSGSREINEAGIYAVVHAQPFPPFPDDAGSEPVDVHVRMWTGGKAGSQKARSVAIPLAPSLDAGTVMSGK